MNVLSHYLTDLKRKSIWTISIFGQPFLSFGHRRECFKILNELLYIPSDSMKTCKMTSRKHSPSLLNKRTVWSDLFLGAVRKIYWPWERFEQGGQGGKLYFTKMNATISSHPKFFYDCATPPSRGEVYTPFPRNWMGLGDYLGSIRGQWKCHSVTSKDSI